MNLADLSWPRIASCAPETTLVFPIAAIEQHGHHLPLSTDNMLLTEIVRRAQLVLREDPVLFAPQQWLGNSDHHLNFAGTLSLHPEGYVSLLGRLLDNAICSGFRRIVFLNGHGGNDIPGRQAIFEARQRHRSRNDLLLLFTTYWDHGMPWEDRPDFVQRSMGHACEWETSMVLALRPELVGPTSELEDIPMGYEFEPAYRGWITDDRSRLGHIGCPRHSSGPKGEHLFECYAKGVVGFLRKVSAWKASPIGDGWQTAHATVNGCGIAS
jgi:creatinine amidohydrolase